MEETWSTHSSFSVWPCDLFIVIAKHGLTGNWTLLNWNDSSLSDGIKGILSIMSTSPVNGLCEILASMRLAVPFFMIHCVPFISLGGSSDRKRMIGQPFLSVSSCGGRPLGSILAQPLLCSQSLKYMHGMITLVNEALKCRTLGACYATNFAV